MARSVGEVVVNNLSRGLITEATGLNFPDNAVIEADNIDFDPVGSAARRLGIDIEGDSTPVAYENTDGIVREFFWNAIGLTNDLLFLVVQVGINIYFYRLSDPNEVSINKHDFEIDLLDYLTIPGVDLHVAPCVFTAGAGYLFIANPYTDPLVIEYIDETESFELQTVTVKIRDLEGVDDDLELEERPETLSNEHHYNLQNQGWNKSVRTGNKNNEI